MTNKHKILHRETGYLFKIYNYKFFFPDTDTSSTDMFEKINNKQAYMMQGYCNCCGLIDKLPEFKIYEEHNNIRDTSLLFPEIVKLGPVIIDYTIDDINHGSSKPSPSSVFIYNGKEFYFIEGRSLNYTIWRMDCDLLPKAID